MGQISYDTEAYKSVIDSTKSDLIITTRDKLELTLIRHEDSLKKKDWMTPLGVVVSCTAALISSTFNKSLGLEGAVWKAMFIIVDIISTFLLLKAIIQICKNTGESSVQAVIDTIKKESESLDPSTGSED
ncbi:MAG: hypothetical protein KBS80_07055 [Bacteroidales bacterium]|nr:hypothetical protein [Candidatus Cryptobacteroides choladohippi]